VGARELAVPGRFDQRPVHLQIQLNGLFDVTQPQMKDHRIVLPPQFRDDSVGQSRPRQLSRSNFEQGDHLEAIGDIHAAQRCDPRTTIGEQFDEAACRQNFESLSEGRTGYAETFT